MTPGSAATNHAELRCAACAWGGPVDLVTWRCPACLGPLDFAEPRGRARLNVADLVGTGVGRYSAWIGQGRVPTLGEPMIPAVELVTAGGKVQVRNEGLMPTGSFKDRGAATLAGWLRDAGATRVMVDSSGNAGAAIAAYCSSVGLDCELYVPAGASAPKVEQARRYGAVIVTVDGDRMAAHQAAASAAAAADATYASHMWSPAFLLGTRTLAFELWEQCGGELPDAVVLPVGAGTLLLGLARGFADLAAADLCQRVPRLFAAQEACCAPLAGEFGDVPVERVASPAAEGIQVADPPRLQQLVLAVADSGGRALAVTQSEIHSAAAVLLKRGIDVEPTAATALAGWLGAGRRKLLGEDERALVILTGAGWKTS